MNSPSYGDREPIAAIATPLGESALALIRTSGGGEEGGQSAIGLLARVFSRPQALLSAPGNSIVHGWMVESAAGKDTSGNRKKLDEVLVSVYRAPRSYTGEDGADISCHGGIAAVKAVMTALKRAGFRDALPGEFTFRAFMNGKLDLTAAESVMEIVAAKTGRARDNALRRLAGVLEREITAIKSLLVEILAGTEIYLDYSEDEFLNPDGDEEAGRLPGRKLAEEAARRLKSLSELWRRERIYAEGALAVIAGRPNAGKSSLFNYLIAEDRSIVTDAPGTTRDWIEALISIDDIPLRLADTAGLREPSIENSEAERIGINRSLELLDKADIVLYVIDGSVGITESDGDFLSGRKESAPRQPLLVLWNKADLKPPPSLAVAETGGALLAVSAKTGEDIPALTRSIAGLLEAASSTEGGEAAGPGTSRQKELIDSSLSSVEEALALSDKGEPLDIIAPLFRSAVDALGEITGDVYSVDILEVMFSRFCVGK
ncbi:MAG: tRNA uridine-5-carboxymethylaminomethyl(34) synthesis GTPase MnmE [Treponema sp.]|jgi:tRNA modification GTPase|nr:tRNA uridine-5-carboxymethylaminomethyl(34) synthesis GTPase MnmE [Treponema sp.]